MRSILVLGLLGLLMLPARADEAGEIAKRMMSEITSKYGAPHAVAADTAAYEVFHTLCGSVHRQDIPYSLSIVDKDVVNAYALPDGRVVVFTGLLQALPDRDAVAFVLAHELSHVEDEHATQSTVADGLLGTALNVVLWRQAWWLQTLGGVAFNLFSSGYGRGMEAEADSDGMDLATRAGFNPQGALTAFRLFEKMEAQHPGLRIFPTHPRPADRYKDAVAWLEEHEVPLPPGEVVGPSQLPKALGSLDSDLRTLQGQVALCPRRAGDEVARKTLTQAAESLQSYRVMSSAGDPAAAAQLQEGLSSLESFGILADLLPLDSAQAAQVSSLVKRAGDLAQAQRQEQAARLARLTAYLAERARKSSESHPLDSQGLASLNRLSEGARAYEESLKKPGPSPQTTLSDLIARGAEWERTSGRLQLEPRYYASYYDALQRELVATGICTGQLNANAGSLNPPRVDPAFVPDSGLGRPAP